MSADPLTCREFVELVTDYLEGSLPDAERRRFEDHLAACPGCGTYLVQMRHTIAAAGRLDEESITPEAQQTLLEAFRRWKDGRSPA